MGDIEQPPDLRGARSRARDRRCCASPRASPMSPRRTGTPARAARANRVRRGDRLTHSSHMLFFAPWRRAARPRARPAGCRSIFSSKINPGALIGCMPCYLKSHTPRRIRVRPWLGRRLSARRRPLLSEAAGLRSPSRPSPGGGCSCAPATTRRARGAPVAGRRSRSPTGSASPRCTSPFPRARNGSLPARSASSSEPTSNSIGGTRAIASFDDFLGALASRKRKAIRKERREALARRHRDRMGDGKRPHRGASRRLLRLLHGHGLAQMGLALSDAELLQPARRDHGRPDGAHSRQARRAAMSPARSISSARTRSTAATGAASRTTPSSISRSATTRPSSSPSRTKLARVEAGAQGAHKLARGYLPAETYSAHYIADPALRRAVADYLKRERRAVVARDRAARRGIALSQRRH